MEWMLFIATKGRVGRLEQKEPVWWRHIHWVRYYLFYNKISDHAWSNIHTEDNNKQQGLMFKLYLLQPKPNKPNKPNKLYSVNYVNIIN